MSTPDDIARLFEQYECGISYTPLDSEVVPTKTFPALSPKIIYRVEPDPSIDPFQESQKVQEMAEHRSTFILIPGQQFDAVGTRHGRGAGWYDRFLSVTPKNWLRVGVCYEEQFSRQTLVRQSWDEVMDFVFVVNKKSGEINFYETHTRDNADTLSESEV